MALTLPRHRRPAASDRTSPAPADLYSKEDKGRKDGGVQDEGGLRWQLPLLALGTLLKRIPQSNMEQMGKTCGGSTASNIHGPDHLLVLVHGILASASDWTYAEVELKRQLGSSFLIYVSSSNAYSKTFAGIDGAGRRLADEVINIVQKTESLRRISFLAHSLGGLFARYAIAVLHSSDKQNESQRKNLNDYNDGNPDKLACISTLDKIAGLEPINFITLATPHLGVRGRRQLPFLLGVTFLEKLAAPLAPIFTGQTGRQLFLTDGKPKESPLLLRMASDYEDLKFISALAAFKNCILYMPMFHMTIWWVGVLQYGGRRSLLSIALRSLQRVFIFLQKQPRQKRQPKICQTQNTREYHDIMEGFVRMQE